MGHAYLSVLGAPDTRLAAPAGRNRNLAKSGTSPDYAALRRRLGVTTSWRGWWSWGCWARWWW